MVIKINDNFLKLQASYLFTNIANKVLNFKQKKPKMEIIKLGKGDVTCSLPSVCLKAFHFAVSELGNDDSFRGYGPAQGFDFLRNSISEYDFKNRGIDISADEIFVSDGSKCDIANIQELLDLNIKIAIPDPIYPVYLDSNVMAGRTGKYIKGRYGKIIYLDSVEENGFVPKIPSRKVDLIYLCFPNNPTGATISKEKLSEWVKFAKECKALIFYDSAYEAFIREENLPHSIYEIEGAQEVAIEFRSFSKNAGFTGVRCAYAVVPKKCLVYTKDEESYSLNKLWYRRQTTKFNGVSYPVQRAAEAIYSFEGQQEVKELVNYYMTNANLIKEFLHGLNIKYVGGENSPYLWINTKIDSWSFFNLLLEDAGVVCTPGSGFGKCGNKFVRISSFNSYNKTLKGMERAKPILDKYCKKR